MTIAVVAAAALLDDDCRPEAPHRIRRPRRLADISSATCGCGSNATEGGKCPT